MPVTWALSWFLIYLGGLVFSVFLWHFSKFLWVACIVGIIICGLLFENSISEIMDPLYISNHYCPVIKYWEIKAFVYYLTLFMVETGHRKYAQYFLCQTD